jgi:hypothetical protein
MIRKNLFLSLALIVAVAGSASGQCIPDATLISPGYRPDTLEHAKVNVPYSQTISVRTPRDTSMVVAGQNVTARVDSIKATSVTGLPPGLTYKCQNPRCVFLWDTTRCVEIYGTPTNGGVYPITINVTYYAKVSGFSVAHKDSIKRFTITVDGSTTAVLDNSKPNVFAFPNPVSAKLYISGASATCAKKIQIFDLKGALQAVRIYAENGLWIAEMGALTPGVYLLQTDFGVKRIEVLAR